MFQKVGGSIPRREATDWCFSHIRVSLFLSLPAPPLLSLKSVNTCLSLGEDLKQTRREQEGKYPSYQENHGV